MRCHNRRCFGAKETAFVGKVSEQQPDHREVRGADHEDIRILYFTPNPLKEFILNPGRILVLVHQNIQIFFLYFGERVLGLPKEPAATGSER